MNFFFFLYCRLGGKHRFQRRRLVVCTPRGILLNNYNVHLNMCPSPLLCSPVCQGSLWTTGVAFAKSLWKRIPWIPRAINKMANFLSFLVRNFLGSDGAYQISYIKCGIINSQKCRWPRLWYAVSFRVYRISCLVLALG